MCVGIGAWNYPFQIACWKSAPALACGERRPSCLCATPRLLRPPPRPPRHVRTCRDTPKCIHTHMQRHPQTHTCTHSEIPPNAYVHTQTAPYSHTPAHTSHTSHTHAHITHHTCTYHTRAHTSHVHTSHVYTSHVCAHTSHTCTRHTRAHTPHVHTHHTRAHTSHMSHVCAHLARTRSRALRVCRALRLPHFLLLSDRKKVGFRPRFYNQPVRSGPSLVRPPFRAKSGSRCLGLTPLNSGRRVLLACRAAWSGEEAWGGPRASREHSKPREGRRVGGQRSPVTPRSLHVPVDRGETEPGRQCRGSRHTH